MKTSNKCVLDFSGRAPGVYPSFPFMSKSPQSLRHFTAPSFILLNSRFCVVGLFSSGKKTEEPQIPRPPSLTRLQKRRNNRRPGHLIGGALTWDELLTSLTQGTVSDPFATRIFTDRTTLRSRCQINEPLSVWERCSTGLRSHWPPLTKHTLYSPSSH